MKEDTNKGGNGTWKNGRKEDLRSEILEMELLDGAGNSGTGHGPDNAEDNNIWKAQNDGVRIISTNRMI